MNTKPQVSSKPYKLQSPRAKRLTWEDKAKLFSIVKKARPKFSKARNPEAERAVLKKFFDPQLNPQYPFLEVLDWVDALIAGDYGLVGKIQDETQSDILINVYDIPYNSKVKGLEMTSIGKRFDFVNYQEAFPSNAVAITTVPELTTDAFNYGNPRDVATFGENIRNSRYHSSSNAYYKVDKFFNRFHDVTKLILNSDYVDESSFELVRKAKDADLLQAIGVWLSCHEHFHRQGPIPRVKQDDLTNPLDNLVAEYGFYIKESRSSGAFEELRVDLETLVEADTNKMFNPYKSKLIRDFVLSERLLRYVSEADPKDDFDSIASQTLFNYMLKSKALSIKDGVKLELNQDRGMVTDTLLALRNSIRALEESISQKIKQSIQNDFQERLKSNPSLSFDDYLKEETARIKTSNNTAMKQEPIVKSTKKELTEFMKEWTNLHTMPNIKDTRYTIHPFYMRTRKGVLRGKVA